ncbi:MAG TPA: LytTR family DNA-binding domain-containing protein [Terriglobales bacterium]|jgi:two-component system LytT family response regulator|nr:LytTR family DNA-binding domain-containing protein [Terriglobales bacterium]
MPATQIVPMRALIVDDELHARRYLQELLGNETEVTVVGEAATGTEGLDLLRELSPDLVFLDIQMPGLDGFGMVEGVAAETSPMFIFVTGYSEYAVRAFEIEAVDYLCKPFDKERLSIALERAARHFHARQVALESGRDTQYLSRLSIKEEDGIVFVPVDQILWIEAANKYVVVHTIDHQHILRQTIQSLEDTLDPKQFVRIHRSILVRKAAVRGLHPLFHGDYLVKLSNGVELTLSRSFRGTFFQQIGR